MAELQERMAMFENRLRKVNKHISKIAQKKEINCYRIYDHDLPEFPLAIDRYMDVIHVSEYLRKHAMNEEEHDIWMTACKQIISTELSIPLEHIYVKLRQRKQGRKGQYIKNSEDKIEKIVVENGLSFIINLSDYLDTGLFLDHRITRELVCEKAKNKKVLNLFCYTGSFSVYAAKGGAATVTSIDLSKTYIHWAKRNMQYNKLYDADQHFFIEADVLETIKNLPKAHYDLIICDPPTFSNSKKMDVYFDVQEHHVVLLNQLLELLRDKGEIYFSNNYKNFILDEPALHATIIKNITGLTTSFDFQGKLHRSCYWLQK